MNSAVIFDLDGTLLDTLDDICDVVNSVLHSNRLSCRSIDEVRSAVGRGVEELVRKLIPIGDLTDELVGKLSDQIRKTYLEQGSIKTRPYTGIRDLLERLQTDRVPMAVLTNKHHLTAERLVKKYFADINFAFVGGARQGCPLKPFIESVTPVLDQLGAPPGNTLMVGDSDVDMDTAVNAGMIAVGVSWGFREVSLLQEHGSDFIVDSPGEILEIVQKGCRG